jgi:hypothetical protein
MARGRMLSKSISTSEKVNRLLPEALAKLGHLDPSRGILLYTWLLAHSDDFGKMDGSVYWIRLSVVPALNFTENEISDILKCLHEVKLINLYNVNDKKYIQIIDFDNHQTGLHKRTTSKFPEIPGNTGAI